MNGFNLFLPFDIATSLFLDINPTMLIEIVKNAPYSVIFDIPVMRDVHWLLVVNKVIINNFDPFLYTHKLVIVVWLTTLALEIVDIFTFLQNFGTYQVLADALYHYFISRFRIKTKL